MTITSSEFNYIRRLVLDQSAIVLEEDKQYLAEARLSPVARRAGFESLASMVAWMAAKKFDGFGDDLRQVDLHTVSLEFFVTSPAASPRPRLWLPAHARCAAPRPRARARR